MAGEEKRKYMAVGLSLLIHLVLFAAIASAGLFVQAAAPAKKPLEVAVYDADALENGNAGQAAAAGGAAPAAADIVLKENIPLPEIAESYTQTPAKQQEYKELHKQTASQGTTEGTAASAGQSQAGSGAGAGPETGAGGNGGSNAGTGSGEGRDPGAAQRPKTPPQLLSAAAPVYPESLRQQNAEGTVRVRLLVGIDGGVQSAEVSESSNYGEMDTAALQAAYSYRFSPALNVYGEPVACHITRRIHFDLR